MMKDTLKNFLAAALFVTLLPGAALAMNTDSTNASEQADSYKAAKQLVDAQQYEQAIPLLQSAIKQKGPYADALNLLGFSYRKLGQQALAFDYYNKALALEPKHPGANEYLGELYLEMKNLPKAEERLAVLKQSCGGCEESQDLEKAIDAYKKTN